jgi:nitrogen-specific signal transduction histidine kinase
MSKKHPHQTSIPHMTGHESHLPRIHPPDHIVYSLVQEIRNPLTNIGLSAEILELLVKNDDLKIYMDIILRNSTRVNNLIIEILSYSPSHKMNTEKILRIPIS